MSVSQLWCLAAIIWPNYPDRQAVCTMLEEDDTGLIAHQLRAAVLRSQGTLFSSTLFNLNASFCGFRSGEVAQHSIRSRIQKTPLIQERVPYRERYTRALAAP